MRKIRVSLKRFLMRTCALELSVLLGAAVLLLTQVAMVSSPAVQAQDDLTISSYVEMPETEDSNSWALSPEDVADYLVESVIQVESGGRPNMVGKAGERGIMQIKRTTWAHVTRRMDGEPIPFDRAFDPALNRRVGKAYMAEIQQILHTNRSLWKADERSLILACYNAGPERVRQAGYDLRRLPGSVQCYVERASALHDYYLAENAHMVREMLLTALTPSTHPGKGG